MITHLAAALSSRTISARQEAIGELLEAAEIGTDLTAALGALGRALSDGDGTVREGAGQVLGYWTRAGGAPGDAVAGLVDALGNVQLALVARECLRDSLSGPDVGAILTALEATLSGDARRFRGAAGLLTRGWLRSESPHRVAALLTNPRPEVRSGACEAAVASVRDGADGSALTVVLDPLLLDAAPGVSRHAAWLLSRAQPERVVGLLIDAHAEVRLGALIALEEACDGGHPPQEHGPIRACLSDPVADIRQQTTRVFAALARAGAALSESVPALGAALSDVAPDVRHEAVAALLWLARSGQDLAGAGIPTALVSGGVRLRRTAATAWGWHLLSRGTAEEAAALLASSDRHVRLGAASGMAERYLEHQDVGGLLDLLMHTDGLIGEAVIATMRQRRADRRRISAGLTALHLLQQGGLVDAGRARALSAQFLQKGGR